MAPPPLDYVSPDCALPRRWPCRLLVGTVVGVLGAGLLQSVPVQQVQRRIDAVTGTMTRKTVWPFGLSSGTRVDVSPLETRLKQAGIPWTSDWRFLHDTDHNVFGLPIRRGCGSAPPIYSYRPVLGAFAAASTDDELRDFVRVMEAGTGQEQSAAVEAAGEKGLTWSPGKALER